MTDHAPHCTSTFLLCCVCMWRDNKVHYSILPQNKDYYILSYQHFPPEDLSFLRILSLHAMTLLSLVFFPMKEKTNGLFETVLLSTSRASDLWKSGCPWVAVTDALSASYLHLHIHEYMDYGCEFVTILLYVTWLMLCTFAEALSFSLIIIRLLYYECVQVCICPVFPALLYLILLIIQAFQTALYRINPSPFIWRW